MFITRQDISIYNTLLLFSLLLPPAAKNPTWHADDFFSLQRSLMTGLLFISLLNAQRRIFLVGGGAH